ncbi:uncharacterized protein LTR77_010436 [Saxophila tyrrhenica]|uniref:JmjC domain-containing protein n=1 Tax=Saxophila tyrrhenica TaxID=1690608 RepID=A0AAV9NVI7_9PEZI|nr:hypothetical protein LTR77_010436 [Saxophila tyrrhenica]
MPATRPRASFEPISPDFDLKALVESTEKFSYVDRISVDMIDQQGLPAFEKLVLLHVIVGGKPLVIDGFEDRLDPWTFTPKWLESNCGDKQENSRNLTSKDNLPLTMAHYLSNMGMLTNQFFGKPGAYKEPKRQRVYLKDIDCPPVWQDKLREHIPSMLYYLNESTGDVGGPGAVPESNVSGRRLGKGIARAGDLMSSLPPDMRAENLMCYIGHEGTYTPSHREMCASLGQNIMVEASNTVNDDGKAEKPGSSIWFMTESKERHMVSEYWLSVLGHDIEVENHFAQVVAWKKAPFHTYVVEQRPGDFILIPPLAPHQVWNRGTRTMKVAWNRTTVETLEMALNEALPRSRIVCRDEQYKNKAIIYYALQKYSGLLTLAQTQASRMPNQEAAHQLLTSPKIKQLAKDFKRLFNLYRQILLSEMFNPDEAPPKQVEYLPFDGNVTCAYCRGNIFNRFLTCPSCKDVLGHHTGDGEGDPYDVCMDCYAMGRSCACISNLKWAEQFRWKELAAKYETWRKLIIAFDGGQVTDKTPLPINEERKRLGKTTLAQVCKEQLKQRPWKDVHKSSSEPKSDAEEEEEIIVDDNGNVKKTQKKRSKAWLNNNSPCHVCCHRHPNWKMAQCTKCERRWCYGSLFRGWDKMPIEIMEDKDWECPHCLGICFAGACKTSGKMNPYEPKGTLLGHDTKQVADARSVEALVDFSVSNLNWLKEDDPANRAQSKRLQRAQLEAQKAKETDPTLEDEDVEADNVDESRVDETQMEMEDIETEAPPIDPALTGNNGYEDDESFALRLQQANKAPTPGRAPRASDSGEAPDGYAPVSHAGYVPPPANMYPQPDEANGAYNYPGFARPTSVEPMRDGSEELVGGLRPFKRSRPADEEDAEGEDIAMTKGPKSKKPRMTAAGFRSLDLADGMAPSSASKAKNEAQRQFEKEKERKALDKAKAEGRFIMLSAALRGKRRVVRLLIPREKLAQIMAQQAAKAALTAGDEADADGGVDDGVPQPAPEATEADDGEMVLKSDIQPKKTKDTRAYYQQRQQSGHVVVGGQRKALIPVEKDDNYRQYTSQKKVGGGGGGAHRKGRNAPNVDYEEVDIGSDDEGVADNDFILVSASRAGSSAVRKPKDRRSLPNYLQRRGDDAEEEFPDELPSEYRDRTNQDRSSRPKKANGLVGRSRKSASLVESSLTAGKRPSVRPPPTTIDLDADAEGDMELDDVTIGAIDDAANGEWMDVDEVVDAPGFAAVNHPARGTAGKSVTFAPDTDKSARLKQKNRAMDEQNRLAKLQALDMVDEPSMGTGKGRAGGGKGGHVVSMAGVLGEESEDEDEGDEIEVVPARRVGAARSLAV